MSILALHFLKITSLLHLKHLDLLWTFLRERAFSLWWPETDWILLVAREFQVESLVARRKRAVKYFGELKVALQSSYLKNSTYPTYASRFLLQALTLQSKQYLIDFASQASNWKFHF